MSEHAHTTPSNEQNSIQSLQNTLDQFFVDDIANSLSMKGKYFPVIVAAAGPIINLAHGIRQSVDQPSIEKLHQVAISAIKKYERDLLSVSINAVHAKIAHYVLCATLDDVILSKTWGIASGWARLGLVSTYHMDVNSGDRVFEILAELSQNPSHNIDLLILFYFCLSLGFEGRTRIMADGATEMTITRDALYNTIMRYQGGGGRTLSLHPSAAMHFESAVRGWLDYKYPLLAAFLMLAILIGQYFFNVAVDKLTQPTLKQLSDLSAYGVVTIESAKILPTQPHTKASNPASVSNFLARKVDVLNNLSTLLKPEIDKQLITINSSNGRLLVKISSFGLFPSGSANVTPEFHSLLKRIGVALAAEKCRAVVYGHTDSVPIHNLNFGSNLELSSARAKTVANILTFFTGQGTVLSEGLGDSRPVAANDTPANRDRNRRIEILVLTDPSDELNSAAARSGFE
ncbi:type IVB secretion system protein IcmH/DotU [Ochrobactrum sp. GPK 3]|uniref:type IVB secretion system protein IcmH/DotU n=1 Tax=Brucella sp. 22210 TaxID=3453892 RepID=UPI00313858A7